MNEVPTCQWISLITRIVRTNGITTAFSISVSLEARAITSHQQWARILLVYRPIPLCEPLVLQRLALTAADLRSRARNERPFTHPISDESSIPTIVIEVYYKKVDRIAQACLRTLHTVPEIAVCEFKIAYGWTQKFSRESQTCTAVFQPNWPFYDVPDSVLVPTIAVAGMSPRVPGQPGVVFDVHLFSLGTRRAGTTTLFSEDIIRKIGRHLVRNSPENWRKDLLSFGLSCKNTLAALDLFFEVLDEEFLEWGFLGNNGPSIRSLLSSLKWNPDKANLIQCVSPGFYKDHWPRKAPGEVHSGCCDVFIELLALAKQVRRFDLPDLHPQFYPQLMESLEAMRNVEICHLEVNGIHSLGSRLTFSPHDVFKLLSLWPLLHTLKTQIRRSSGATAHTETQIPFETTCNLRYLSITDSELEESTFFRFLPSNGPSRLSTLGLRSVTGISKEEFRTFIDTVAPVITDIRIASCKFGSACDNEYVVPDETVARMTLLKTVITSGCGNLFGPACICTRENRIPGSKLRLLNASPFRKQDVISALRSAKWDYILVKMDSLDDDGEVKRIARQQGVEFHRAAYG